MVPAARVSAHHVGHHGGRRAAHRRGLRKGAGGRRVGKMAEHYDIAVVGGGIAGVAIAEVFARSGRSVALVEKNAHLCQEASASQHGWFHFGSLFSIFPQNQFLRTMVGGIEDLMAFYGDFAGMNIEIGEDGRLIFPQRAEAWFRDEPIEYIVTARNDPDFDMRRFTGVREYIRKIFFLLTWEMAIKQFISRHQRFWAHDWRSSRSAAQWIPKAGWTDYSRNVISKPDFDDILLDADTHFRIVGYDRPMRAERIITDLTRSLLGAGGDIMTNTQVLDMERDGKGVLLHCAGAQTRISARRVIFAAGKWLGHFLPQKEDLKVVASPLLVVYPAMSTRHFVRMTPFVERSINHIWHEVDGARYSLIGGGYYADPEDPAAVARAKEKLLQMARSVFPGLAEAQLVESYLGYKTEIIPKTGERNYQYFIRQVDDDVWAVVPGKFSLAFSLAVNVFKKLTGEVPSRKIKLEKADVTAAYVSKTRHAALVANMLASHS